jgi:hypothetical protein
METESFGKSSIASRRFALAVGLGFVDTARRVIDPSTDLFKGFVSAVALVPEEFQHVGLERCGARPDAVASESIDGARR